MKHYKSYIFKNKALIIFAIFSILIPLSVVFGEGEAKKDTGFIYKINNPREPFMPLVSADGTVVNLEPQSDISDIHLEGIIFDPGGKSYAVINGNVIAENDSVGNFKLKEIKKDKIILQNGENTHIIELIKEDAGEKKL